jgi:LCP family protein required for cell wall assembly
MSDTPDPNDAAGGPEHAADRPSERPGRHKRRGGRVALLAVAAVLVVLCAAVAASYATINHLAGKIQRIPNVFGGLNETARPVMPAASRHSMTLLLTSSGVLSAALGHGAHGASPTGLVMLVHLDASQRSGAVVSIPANALVAIPGHGAAEIGNTPMLGGPALLIKTVEKLTDVRIDHYAVLDFAHTISLIDALGGVDVEMPRQITTGSVTFHPGLNHLDGATALDYVLQPTGIDAGEEGRALRQKTLTRAIVDKIGRQDLLRNPVEFYRILNAFTQALSVDSNLTNAELRTLMLQLRALTGRNGTFVTAPTRTFTAPGGSRVVVLAKPESGQLWSAIRSDSVAAFATAHPGTVTTPVAPH